MEAKFVLAVLFLGHLMVTYAGISHAKTSDITRLTEGEPSPECNEEGCIVQDEGLNSMNPVIVHKRNVRHKSTRHQIREFKKQARFLKQSMNRELMERKTKLTKLAKIRKMNLHTKARAGTKSLYSFIKHSMPSNDKELTPAVVKNLTVSTGKETAEIVNATTDDLSATISHTAGNIKDLASSFVGKLKTFTDNSLKTIKEAADSGDMKGAQELLSAAHKTVGNVANASSRKLKEFYKTAEREVKDLVNKGVEVVVNTTKNQVNKIKEALPTTNEVKTYVNKAADTISNFSKDSTDMFNALAKYGLEKSDELVKYAQNELQKYKNILENQANNKNPDTEETQRKLDEIEEENKKKFDELLTGMEKKITAESEKGKAYISSLKKLTFE